MLHFFLHIMSFPIPPQWGGQEPFTAKHRCLFLISPVSHYLRTVDSLRRKTNCLQDAASVEQAELGAFTGTLGTHIRLFYESVSDIILFN